LVQLYLEGGNQLRSPMAQFLRRAVGSVNLTVWPSGSAENATSRCARDPDSLLLIDSEGVDLVDLNARVTSRIGRPDRVFFMVQLMETWFLADQRTLRDYYGRGFNNHQLPANPRVENIPKDDVINGLRAATRECNKRAYHKGKHAPDLLNQLDPTNVYNACPNFALLIDHLREHAAS